MKSLICGIVAGVALAVAVTNLPAVAPWYSQAIYDCGIRIASGVTGGAISFDGFVVVGHKTAICIDSSSVDATPIAITGVRETSQ